MSTTQNFMKASMRRLSQPDDGDDDVRISLAAPRRSSYKTPPPSLPPPLAKGTLKLEPKADRIDPDVHVSSHGKITRVDIPAHHRWDDGVEKPGMRLENKKDIEVLTLVGTDEQTSAAKHANYENDTAQDIIELQSAVTELVPSLQSFGSRIDPPVVDREFLNLTPSFSFEQGAIVAAEVTTAVSATIDETPQPPPIALANLVDENGIRETIENEILQQAVQADMVDTTGPTNLTTMEESQEEELKLGRRFRRRMIYFVAFVIAIILVIVVVAFTVTNKENTPPSAPPSPTLVPITLPPASSFAPSIVGNRLLIPSLQPTTPPQYLPTDLLQIYAQRDLFSFLQSGVNHTLFVSYIEHAQLAEYLNSDQFTIFAPTDASWRLFSNASESYAYYTNVSNFQWIGHLTLLLQYHVLFNSRTILDIFERYGWPTAASELDLAVTNIENTVGDNAAIIVTADIKYLNGYIHIPDRVLIPDQLNSTISEWIATLSSFFQVQNLSQIIHSTNPDTSIFSSLLQQTSTSGLTLVAPTDTAFASFNWTNSATYNSTNNDDGFVLRLMGNHLIETNLYNIMTTLSSTNAELVTTYSGYSIWITIDDRNKTFFNGVPTATASPYYVKNGLGYLLEITSNVTTNYRATTFLNVINGPAQLGNLLHNNNDKEINIGNSTFNNSFLSLLAPMDHVFSQNGTAAQFVGRFLRTGWLLHVQRVIQHHMTFQTISSTVGQHEILMSSGYNATFQVQSDGNITVNDIQIEPVNNGPLRAVNGAIYFLKGLLIPSWTNVSIGQALDSDPYLSELAFLVASSNLTEVVNEAGPITLLAPSNTALTDLNITSLTSRQNILRSHILDGNWYLSSLLSNISDVVAVNNRSWQVHQVGNHTYIGGALITTANVLASNGVIHIIEGILGGV